MHHSECIGSPSNGFFGWWDSLAGQLKDLKKVAEGDAKPKGETTSQCVEQASILKFESYLRILNFVSYLSILTESHLTWKL